MSAPERERCPRCGLAYADDNDTTHECPPGFETTLRELAAWPRCNDGTYLKIPRRRAS